MRHLLIATMILFGSATAVSASDFRVVVDAPEQRWFIEPSAITSDENGIRRAHIYVVHKQGVVMGGKTIRFTDQRWVFDCASGTYHPEEFVFLDENFDLAGTSPFPNAEGRKPNPSSGYGRIMAAICGTDTSILGRTITADDWTAAASQP